MNRRNYDTSDYLYEQPEKSVEVTLPMHKDDLLSLRRDITDTRHNFADNNIAPQHTRFVATGFTGGDGSERITLETCHSYGNPTRFSVQLSQPSGSLSLEYDPQSPLDQPKIIETIAQRGNVTSSRPIPAMDAILLLTESVTKENQLIEPLLQLRTSMANPSVDQLTQAVEQIAHAIALSETRTKTYSNEDQSYVSEGIPFSQGSIILQETLTDTTLGEVGLALSSTPLSPDTGLPLQNASYGYHFSFANTPYQQPGGHFLYGTASGFGRLSHPTLGEEFLRQTIQPYADPDLASQYYREVFVDAMRTLADSQIPEIDF